MYLPRVLDIHCHNAVFYLLLEHVQCISLRAEPQDQQTNQLFYHRFNH